MHLTNSAIFCYTTPMRPSPAIMKGLKYATYVLLACTAVIAAAVALKMPTNTKGLLVETQSAPLNPNGIPFKRFTAQDVIDGFSAPSDTHVFFQVPANTVIPRITFFGGPDFDDRRYWGYCFLGDEVRNKEKGLTGNQLYHADRFFYSSGELRAQRRPVPAQDPVSVAQRMRNAAPTENKSLREMFYGGETCYLMTADALPVGVDTDEDGINNFREKLFATDPQNADTDGDGIPDGQEVFFLHSNPQVQDTDGDGLTDVCEIGSPYATSDAWFSNPLDADTDKDGLCDGDGTGSSCPERKHMSIVKTDTCPPETPYSECALRLTLVHGEDMNQNCRLDDGETDPKRTETYQDRTDWQYKFEHLNLTAVQDRPRVP